MELGVRSWGRWRHKWLILLNRGPSIALPTRGTTFGGLPVAHFDNLFDRDLFKPDYLVGKNSGIRFCIYTDSTYHLTPCSCSTNISFIHHLGCHRATKEAVGVANVFHKYPEWKHRPEPSDSTHPWAHRSKLKVSDCEVDICGSTGTKRHQKESSYRTHRTYPYGFLKPKWDPDSRQSYCTWSSEE